MQSYRFAVLAALFGGALTAQGPPATPKAPLYKVGGGVKAPVLLSKVEPEYSEDARKAKLQGTVLLYVVIDPDGHARDMKVLKSLGLGLDENAVTAVALWSFAPATKDEQPVNVEATIEVNFRLLLGPAEWSMEHASFLAPAGASQPSFLRVQYNPPAGLPEYVQMRLTCDIDADGHPTNIHIDQGADDRWNDEVMAMIREWRFHAAMENGAPVESHAVFDLARGSRTGPPPPMKKQ